MSWLFCFCCCCCCSGAGGGAGDDDGGNFASFAGVAGAGAETEGTLALALVPRTGEATPPLNTDDAGLPLLILSTTPGDPGCSCIEYGDVNVLKLGEGARCCCWLWLMFMEWPEFCLGGWEDDVGGGLLEDMGIDDPPPLPSEEGGLGCCCCCTGGDLGGNGGEPTESRART